MFSLKNGKLSSNFIDFEGIGILRSIVFWMPTGIIIPYS
jgi:hypothetical protein